MNLRDPNVQKILLGGVVLAVLSYVYFGTSFMPFFYQPRHAQIQERKQEYVKLSTELEKARQMINSLEQLEAEYERLHEQWISAQELLPEEQEMPELLRKVTMAGEQSGVEFMLFQPTAVQVNDIYKEHPVQVRVRGGYHQLGMFLSRLANMSRIVNVSHLKLLAATSPKAKQQKKENHGATVQADFTLSAYTLVDPAEVASAEGANAKGANNEQKK